MSLSVLPLRQWYRCGTTLNHLGTYCPESLAEPQATSQQASGIQPSAIRILHSVVTGIGRRKRSAVTLLYAFVKPDAIVRSLFGCSDKQSKKRSLFVITLHTVNYVSHKAVTKLHE
ncbi:unnamed protein product [Acanthoscelides obtectus]|uniref:Uncharacterized protein n=1 Tax=Acanthoscelides obtectus TaxID=200917 RepID=A0A9P0LDS4_ACAOB|nr:unnamed protein product [Acanthoscelides obtectus]CAK1648833.1 hypothetical protein AOBTE_LOCUS15912 [Acanthoscelides obtectus]